MSGVERSGIWDLPPLSKIPIFHAQSPIFPGHSTPEILYPQNIWGPGGEDPRMLLAKDPPLGTLISPLPTQPLDPCTYAGHRTLTVGGHLLRVIVHARGLEQRTAKPAESAPNGATRRSVSRHQGQPPQKTARSGGSRCEAWIVGVLKRPWLVRG